MLRIHPLSRLASAMIIMVAVFLTKSVMELVPIYIFVVLSALLSHVFQKHIRFVGLVTGPLLFALLIVWGWIINPLNEHLANQSGIHYAFFLWLRIVTCGGVLQVLFMPLVENPSHLKSFLERTGLGGVLGTLIIAAIIFLPEMQRRMSQIIDARRAQGASLRGLKGLKEMPTLLMPLISSLLYSAVKRAELWNHRGLLSPGREASQEITYYRILSPLLFIFVVFGLTMMMVVVLV